MTEVLQKNIKDIITEHPAVADLLEKHGIACATCNVGTCRLGDIIEIHNLSPEREKLVKEHAVIKQVLAAVPRLSELVLAEPRTAAPLVSSLVGFIRTYADHFHHAKEEDLLFAYFDQDAEIFRVMREDHEQARNHVRRIADALADNDFPAIAVHLADYRALLEDHIAREDDVLYPWIDRNLSMTQIGRLHAAFADIDSRYGNEPERSETFAAGFPACIEDAHGAAQTHGA